MWRSKYIHHFDRLSLHWVLSIIRQIVTHTMLFYTFMMPKVLHGLLTFTPLHQWAMAVMIVLSWASYLLLTGSCFFHSQFLWKHAQSLTDEAESSLLLVSGSRKHRAPLAKGFYRWRSAHYVYTWPAKNQERAPLKCQVCIKLQLNWWLFVRGKCTPRHSARQISSFFELLKCEFDWNKCTADAQSPASSVSLPHDSSGVIKHFDYKNVNLIIFFLFPSSILTCVCTICFNLLVLALDNYYFMWCWSPAVCAQLFCNDY